MKRKCIFVSNMEKEKNASNEPIDLEMQLLGEIELPKDLQVREYQLKAISNWRNHGYCGVFDMATGTGKTITAILAMLHLYKHCNERLGVVILCPYRHLVNQWRNDLERFGIEVITGYSENPYGDYIRYLENSIICYNNNQLSRFVLLTTNDSFGKREVQCLLPEVKKNLLLIADEAHTLGSEKRSQYLTDLFDYRLALSATFERHWDSSGTKKLKRFFGKNVFSYSLDQAIKDGYLTPYEYHPVICYLSEEEYKEYVEISRELSKYFIDDDDTLDLSEIGKMLLIKRARVVAASRDKVTRLFEIMEHYVDQRNMLIYCGATDIYGTSDRQIDYVVEQLRKKWNMKVDRFTCEENVDDRKRLLKALGDGTIQALTAIKCLDEGVNVPSIETAFILASANNPKEYIQRRGRVLRKSEGKEKAVIYDFISLPCKKGQKVSSVYLGNSKIERSLVNKEMIRMRAFELSAMNREEVQKIRKQIMEQYEIQNIFEEEYEDG